METVPQVVSEYFPKHLQDNKALKGDAVRVSQLLVGCSQATHFLFEAKRTFDWRNVVNKNTEQFCKIIFFFLLSYPEGNCLERSFFCMLSWEPFSTGAFIINHTFTGTNHHALWKAFLRKPAINLPSVVLRVWTKHKKYNSAIVNMFGCRQQYVQVPHKGRVWSYGRHPPGGFWSCAHQQVVPMRSASANVNHSVLRQSGKNTVVQISRCCPFMRQK